MSSRSQLFLRYGGGLLALLGLLGLLGLSSLLGTGWLHLLLGAVMCGLSFVPDLEPHFKLLAGLLGGLLLLLGLLSLLFGLNWLGGGLLLANLLHLAVGAWGLLAALLPAPVPAPVRR